MLDPRTEIATRLLAALVAMPRADRCDLMVRWGGVFKDDQPTIGSLCDYALEAADALIERLRVVGEATT